MKERLNYLWYLSLVTPAGIMLVVTALRSKVAMWIGAIVSMAATYYLCVASVALKWDLYMKAAVTPAQIEAASSDGANKAFTSLFFAPFEAVLWTALWGYVGSRYLKFRKPHSPELTKPS